MDLLSAFIALLIPQLSIGEKVATECRDVTFNRNLVGVVFSPFVTDDVQKAMSFKFADITPMLRQVHLKFNRVAIILYPNNMLVQNFLKVDSIMAAAKLNREENYNSFTQMKLTVILVLEEVEEKIIKKANSIIKVVTLINYVYPNTIDQILVDGTELDEKTAWKFRTFRNFLEKNAPHLNCSIGLQIKYVDVMQAILKRRYGLSPIYEVLKEHRDFTNLYLEFVSKRVKEHFIDILSVYENGKWMFREAIPKGKIGFTVAWLGDEKYGVKFSELVNFWYTMNQFAEDTNTPVIIHQAFDTAIPIDNVGTERSGWWRIIPDGNYINASEFKFENKVCLKDKEIGNEFEKVNMTWLEEKRAFGTYFGVMLIFGDLKTSILHANAELENVVELVANTFSTIGLYLNRDTTLNELEVVERVKKARNGFKVIMMVKEADLSFVINNEIVPRTVDNLIYFTNLLNLDWLPRIEKVLCEVQKNNQSRRYNWGVTIALAFCDKKALQEMSKLDITALALYDTSVSRKQKYYYGVDEAMKKIKALYDPCKRSIVDVFGDIEIILITNWITYEEADYLELIRYADSMNEWAEEENTTVLFNRAFHDSTEDDNMGWWILPGPGHPHFESKHDAAIRIALSKHPRTSKISRSAEIYAGCGILIVFVVGIVAISYYYVRQRRLKYLTKADVDNFFNGVDPFVGSAYNKEYEHGQGQFKIDKENQLGSGMFGKVFKGEIKRDDSWIKVAVKMTQDDCSTTAIKGLLNEIKILSYLGKHQNIVGFIGAYTEELRRNVVHVFMELCEIGSLQNYLQTLTPKAGTESDDIEMIVITKELENDLWRFSCEIANGMEFISGKNIVHKDLATRNILLTNEKIVKISDFGLSQAASRNVTKAKDDEDKPWRWMSPEALKKSEFTEKSDVWAFGVTLWEIYSLGDTPFPEIVYDEIFANCLEGGLRLSIPTYGKNQAYLIMARCWDTKPEKRPTFSQLKNTLENCKLEMIIFK